MVVAIWLCTEPVRAVYSGCHIGGSGFTSLGPRAGHGEFPFSSGCIYPACDTRNALFGVAGAAEFSPGQYTLLSSSKLYTVLNHGQYRTTGSDSGKMLHHGVACIYLG